jgi:hypothetical protein
MCPPRRFLLLMMLPLAACAGGDAIGPAAVVTGGFLIATGKTPVDIVASAVTGRECSVVRLEHWQSWCAPTPVVQPTPYCTRSLGSVDCWTSPPPGAPRQGVADPVRPAAPAAVAPLAAVPGTAPAITPAAAP